MNINELQVQQQVLDAKQLSNIKGGTSVIQTSTDYIITGDTEVF